MDVLDLFSGVLVFNWVSYNRNEELKLLKPLVFL